VKGMLNIFKRLKHAWRGPLVADLPPELAQCEDACHVSECNQGKWEICENRLRRMRDEIRRSRKPGDDSAPS
jgi:hypothetical protein